MADVASSVRVSAHANEILSGLASKLRQPKAQVIETALKEMEERVFWAEVKDAFERIAQDPEESAREKAEMELWNRVSDIDFKDETW